ncbi:hypothetical protein TNCV_2784301 [Trichonephila clavipes]|nr:hypothetical protein TNCV_2784301 [Trichonephila clavipes]
MSEQEITRKLKVCLQQLVEGKALERKKRVDELKLLLKQTVYTQYLNRSTARKKNGSQHSADIRITWKAVFSKIKEYIEQECQKFKERENSSQSLSTTVQTNLMKDKKKCTDLFRAYVNAVKMKFIVPLTVFDHAGFFLENISKVCLKIFVWKIFAKLYRCEMTEKSSLISELASSGKEYMIQCMKQGPFAVASDGSNDTNYN